MARKPKRNKNSDKALSKSSLPKNKKSGAIWTTKSNKGDIVWNLRRKDGSILKADTRKALLSSKNLAGKKAAQKAKKAGKAKQIPDPKYLSMVYSFKAEVDAYRAKGMTFKQAQKAASADRKAKKAVKATKEAKNKKTVKVKGKPHIVLKSTGKSKQERSPAPFPISF